ncbi:hypothetical protein L596_023209 [Steinernema carpocapsae]|uniref:DUF38 domain-containing protein n=1 Tax=Steinernema carpocapsae TaxID=34508 RepID=A0A4U5MD65_STECR|nr:hypothetical protein L596_023209 [Steinernema carpocapsae]
MDSLPYVFIKKVDALIDDISELSLLWNIDQNILDRKSKKPAKLYLFFFKTSHKYLIESESAILQLNQKTFAEYEVESIWVDYFMFSRSSQKLEPEDVKVLEMFIAQTRKHVRLLIESMDTNPFIRNLLSFVPRFGSIYIPRFSTLGETLTHAVQAMQVQSIDIRIAHVTEEIYFMLCALTSSVTFKRINLLVPKDSPVAYDRLYRLFCTKVEESEKLYLYHGKPGPIESRFCGMRIQREPAYDPCRLCLLVDWY